MLPDELPDQLVPVVLPVPLDGPFTYSVPGCSKLQAGQFVTVPFGKNLVTGVVWLHDEPPLVGNYKIKPIEAVLARSPLPAAILSLIEQLTIETLSPRGALLRLAMSVPAALEPGPQKAMLAWQVSDPVVGLNADLDHLQQALGNEGCLTQSELLKRAKLTPARLRKLIEQGFVTKQFRDVDDAPPAQHFAFERPDLSAEQEAASALIESRRELEPFGQILLEGVPGSGKTEVYFDTMAQTLKAGGTSLVLLPEIALSAQWLQRFEQRFGAVPALWHSGCTPAQRRKTWKDVARGRIKVLVGTRSALFLPFPKLDLIVIDEEHDTSYKQEDGVIYDARVAALIRAQLDKTWLILASATPSLETVINIERQGAAHIVMATSHGAALPPMIELADIRSRERALGFLGPALREALSDNLSAGRQSMLFLNRRGYAPLMTCRACGYRFDCGNCTAWLTIHRYRQRMLCHHCGFSRPMPEHCPDCGALDCVVSVGPGVERIADEVQRLLPDARLALITSDTVTGSNKARMFIEAMENRDIDVVVGTQLVAKGHHFPNLTLVGIVDADASLGGNDPRGAERCFQLLYQLAGRAGRGDLRGRVIIQTRSPDHPVIQALAHGDRQQLQDLERQDRELARLPPFGKLAAFIISGRDHKDVRHLGLKLVREAPRLAGMSVLGPAPAPLAMLRGSYRERMLIKADLDIDLPSVLRNWLRQVSVPARLRLTIDVDPQSFF